MTKHLQDAAITVDLHTQMQEMGIKARAAARRLATATTAQKNEALAAAAHAIRQRHDLILAANDKDMTGGRQKGLTSSMLDRLELSPARLDAIADGLEDIINLPDPVGDIIESWDRPNGMEISRIRTPLGVLGVIYESRPNVTVDAGALCLKSGNAVILRGGSESLHSSVALHQSMSAGLEAAGLPIEAISIVPTTDRAAVGYLLSGLDGTIDVIVPRGGKSLVSRVQDEARIPVIGHLDGLCHVYVDRSANPEMAKDIIVNAKMRRTGVCGAAETLLIDTQNAAQILPFLAGALLEAGCSLRGDPEACALDACITPASSDDWYTEYLSPLLSIALVDGVEGAISHIDRYASGHTESIIAEDRTVAERFLTAVDSAIVMHNASTQFADGAEFGMGAEIGIATGRIHARGPVGLEQLTTYKYQVRGSGQIRP